VPGGTRIGGSIRVGGAIDLGRAEYPTLGAGVRCPVHGPERLHGPGRVPELTGA